MGRWSEIDFEVLVSKTMIMLELYGFGPIVESKKSFPIIAEILMPKLEEHASNWSSNLPGETLSGNRI